MATSTWLRGSNRRIRCEGIFAKGNEGNEGRGSKECGLLGQRTPANCSWSPLRQAEGFCHQVVDLGAGHGDSGKLTGRERRLQ